jgi:DNA-3-methyladenine glycosylase
LTLAADHADEPHPRPAGERSLDLRPVARSFLEGPVEEVARALLGLLVLRDVGGRQRVGRIVEAEAYGGPWDRASHARAGRTARSAIMFGPPGHAYVYLVYGMHHCLNVVCGPEGEAAAVLLRAIEPLRGLDDMRAVRGRRAGADVRLGAGPALLCEALGIDRTLNGTDLLSAGPLRLLAPPAGRPRLERGERIVSGPRIGVAYAGEEWSRRPWRVGIAGHPALSRPFLPHP